MSENRQITIFDQVDYPKDWELEWKDMPEWKRIDLQPSQQIIISFRNWEDVKAFGKLLSQRVTRQTKSLWFPPVKTPTGLFIEEEETNES